MDGNSIFTDLVALRPICYLGCPGPQGNCLFRTLDEIWGCMRVEMRIDGACDAIQYMIYWSLCIQSSVGNICPQTLPLILQQSQLGSWNPNLSYVNGFVLNMPIFNTYFTLFSKNGWILSILLKGKQILCIRSNLGSTRVKPCNSGSSGDRKKAMGPITNTIPR